MGEQLRGMTGRTWLKSLRYDPLPPLLTANNRALEYLARRDLLGEEVPPPEELWDRPETGRLLRRQREDGSWPYPGGGKPHLRTSEDYNQIETYRALGELVEQHAATRRLPAVRHAAEFLFSHQTSQGDFRGIYGKQYSPNYTAAIMELLIKAGYGADRRIRRGFAWLVSIRQADGGWAIPFRTRGMKLDVLAPQAPTVEADPAKPFSHLVTGVVLRAFAAHPDLRCSPAAVEAAGLLASRLFRKDPYPDRGSPEYWTRFSFPFWFTDLLSALDSILWITPGTRNPQVRTGLEWLAGRQRTDGTWDLSLLRSGVGKQVGLWVGLGICRVFKRFYSLPTV